MSNSPLISIITIHYNHGAGLRRTVDSILGQEHRGDVEWVVIDGGSTDGSADYLRGLENRIDVLVSERDGGIYDAMNKGLRRASGDYVWFVNAGDALHNAQVLGGLVNAIRGYQNGHHGAGPDVVFGDTLFIDDQGHSLGLISQLKPQPFPKKLHGGSFRFGMNVCHQSVLVKRSLAPEYDETYRLAADVDWMISVLKSMRGESLRLDFVVCDFETGGSSYQHTQKAWKERYAVLSKHYGSVPNFFAHGWILFRRLLFNLNLLGKRSAAA
ncbi:MAG: glycosyltransferase family 2 protein [Bacteroidota bacterium]